MFGALRGRAEKTPGTRTLGEAHVEVVFGDKIKIHARLVGKLQYFQMTLVEVHVRARRVIVFLHVVEQSEFHDAVLT